MKIIAKSFLIFSITISSHAKEINLLCSGTEKQQQNNLQIEVVRRINEVTFNEKTNEVKSFTSRLSEGCVKTEDHVLSTKCQCDVTSDEISCSSEVIGIKFPDWKSEDSFKINRKTGRMTTYKYSGNTKSSFRFTGELNCEKYEKNKF
jgi:hypothetical protein